MKKVLGKVLCVFVCVFMLMQTGAGSLVYADYFSELYTIGQYNISSWAEREVEEANSNGFYVREMFCDYQNEITRLQFCEIIVALYEQWTGKTVNATTSPFIDTSNQDVAKAYYLGIVKGVSATSFAPNDNITRQEICTMIVRAIKVADRYDGNYEYVYFNDGYLIDSWAEESIYYAYKNSIMIGVGNNMINPLGNTTCEEAVVLVQRTYIKFPNALYSGTVIGGGAPSSNSHSSTTNSNTTNNNTTNSNNTNSNNTNSNTTNSNTTNNNTTNSNTSTGGSGNSYENAKNLALNSTVTGELSNIKNNVDKEDWYRIRVDKDGYLKISCVPDNPDMLVFVYLYAKDGDQRITDDSGKDQKISVEKAVQSGEYYVKVYVNSSEGKTNYSLSCEFTSEYMGNDPAGRGTFERAIDISPGDTMEGHIGFVSDTKEVDVDDWYRFSLTRDEKVTIKLVSSNDKSFAALYLFDENGKDRIADDMGSNRGLSITKSLSSGDYYIKVGNSSSLDYFGYRLSLSSDYTPVATPTPKPTTKPTAKPESTKAPEPDYSEYVGTYGMLLDPSNPDSAGYLTNVQSIKNGKITFIITAWSDRALRIYETDPITAPLSGNSADFDWEDGWGNRGTGVITLGNGYLTLDMDQTHEEKGKMLNGHIVLEKE